MRAYRRCNLTGSIGAFALSAAAVISGCTFTTVLPLKATVDRPPSVAPVPLAVGVYYSPEFRAYEHVRTWQNYRYVAPFGQASVTLFDRVLPLIFEKVVLVPGPPPLADGGPKLAAVIEPKIEQFDFDFPSFGVGTLTAEVTYRFTLTSPEGNPFVSWTVRGDGKLGPAWGRTLGDPIDVAMEDAAKKLMTGFRDIPEVRRWLRQAGIPDAR